MRYVIWMVIAIVFFVGGYILCFNQLSPPLQESKELIAILERDCESYRQQRNEAVGQQIMWKTIAEGK